MELWLFVGAAVLILLTVWIMWAPARGGGQVANAQQETTPMRESGIPPQGDRFEDQYTAATADMSAAGVATTDMSDVATPWNRPTTTTPQSTDPIAGGRVLPAPNRSMSLTEPRTLGVGAGLALAIAGGAGGAWLYARWQRERNRPINRLRRGAEQVAHRLSEKDVQEAAPIGGGAAAVLVTSLVLARALRRESSASTRATQTTQDVVADLLDIAQKRAQGVPWSDLLELARDQAQRIPVSEAIERGRSQARRVPWQKAVERGRHEAKRLPQPAQSNARGTGMGIGAIAGIAALCYLAWRVMRGGGGHTQHSPYMSERFTE
jgi:hypothetical protein